MPTTKTIKHRLLVFSGIDGAGKSTQINCLIRRLRERGLRPVYYWSRGGYTGPFNFFKQTLRKFLGKKIMPTGRNEQREKMFKKAGVAKLWLLLAILDLILIYAIYFRYLILTGKIIVADRYLDDTWIDFKLNFAQFDFEQWILWKLLKLTSLKPTHTFLLLIPIDESMRRGKLKNEPFPDSEETLVKRLSFYNQLAEQNSWQILDCLAPINKIEEKIIQSLI